MPWIKGLGTSSRAIYTSSSHIQSQNSCGACYIPPNHSPYLMERPLLLGGWSQWSDSDLAAKFIQSCYYGSEKRGPFYRNQIKCVLRSSLRNRKKKSKLKKLRKEQQILPKQRFLITRSELLILHRVWESWFWICPKPLAQISICSQVPNTQLFTLSQSTANAKAIHINELQG